MYQRISLTQGGYGGDDEIFVLLREIPDGFWRVKYQLGMFLRHDDAKAWTDITGSYHPGWLKRTVDELRILDLKTEKSIGFVSNVIDGTSFSIDIIKGTIEKHIFYHHPFYQLGDFSDIWRADTFWTLLKHPEVYGHGGD